MTRPSASSSAPPRHPTDLLRLGALPPAPPRWHGDVADSAAGVDVVEPSATDAPGVDVLRAPRRDDASAQRGAVTERRPAPATRSGRLQRASSIRVPWAVGLLLFSVIAVAIPLYAGGDPTPGEVPEILLQQQEAVTRHGAQSVRRSVNEGVADLLELANALEVVQPLDPQRERELLSGFIDVHRRYPALYLLGPGPRPRVQVGGEPRPDLLPGDRPFRTAGMQDASLQGEDLVIPQFAPVRRCPRLPGSTAPPTCTPSSAVVAHYEPAFLLNPIGGLELGRAWIVNKKGQVLATPGVAERLPLLPRPDLRDAAARAVEGENGSYAQRLSGGRTEVVAFAPVSGFGPSGSQGWAVVTARPVDQLARTTDDRSRNALALALLTGVAVLVVFGWLWHSVIRPIDELEREADRVAHGDLDRPVEVVRHDEIGLVARSIERLRVAALRRAR